MRVLLLLIPLFLISISMATNDIGTDMFLGSSSFGADANYSTEATVGVFDIDYFPNYISYLSIDLSYPYNNSIFPFSYCWQYVQTNVSVGAYFGTPQTTCNLSYWNGFPNSSYQFYTSQTLPLFNATFNFTGLNSSGDYHIDCSAGVGAFLNTSPTYHVQLYGTQFCYGSGGQNSSYCPTPPSPVKGVYFEVIGFWALICLCMIAWAEINKYNVTIGLIAGVLLILMGVWLLGNSILIKTGTTGGVCQASNSTNFGSNTTNFTQLNTSSFNTYTPVQTPIFNFNQILGVIFSLVGVWVGIRYALRFGDNT
jgi:hypothetical protein